jgi:hypothetical protein
MHLASWSRDLTVKPNTASYETGTNHSTATFGRIFILEKVNTKKKKKRKGIDKGKTQHMKVVNYI